MLLAEDYVSDPDWQKEDALFFLLTKNVCSHGMKIYLLGFEQHR